MTKLKLSAIPDDKPVKITVELPADLFRDLRVGYGRAGHSITNIPTMLPHPHGAVASGAAIFRKLLRWKNVFEFFGKQLT